MIGIDIQCSVYVLSACVCSKRIEIENNTCETSLFFIIIHHDFVDAQIIFISSLPLLKYFAAQFTVLQNKIVKICMKVCDVCILAKE